MPFTLSHISSAQYLTSHVNISAYKEISHAKTLLSRLIEVDLSIVRDICGVDLPLHVLTSQHSLRRSSKNLRYHIWKGSLPEGAILDTGKKFYICSPELTFIQMANILSLPKLIELGFKFCSTYVIVHGEILPSKPLTTVARLKTFISKMYRVHGIKKASQAVQYIAENSASPMESILTMLLCLPYRLGGYGIMYPYLNHPLNANIKAGQRILSRRYVCDLYWVGARLCIEYDSNEYHASKEKMAQDSIRRTDLATIGVMVISVTYPQIKDCTEMHKLAHLVAKKLGKQMCYSEPGFSQARSRLRKTLLGHS